MKIRTKRGDKGIEYHGVKFDGWEVVLGAAGAALILAYFLPEARTVLLDIACGLGGLWLVGVIVVFVVGLVRTPTTPAPESGAGGAPPPQQPPQPTQS